MIKFYEKDDALMTAVEVAEMLRVSVAWVYSHANGNRKPKLPSKKFGGVRRFVRGEVLAFVNAFQELQEARP